MALTRSQRRANISRALSRVRASKGGTTGGVSKGGSVKGFSRSSGGGGSSTPSKPKEKTQTIIVTENGKRVSKEITESQLEAERQKLLQQRKEI